MRSWHGACLTRSRTLQGRWASSRSNVATPNGWRPTATPRADWRLTPLLPSKTYARRVRHSAEQISPSAASDDFDESDRSQPAYQRVLKEFREAVSDRARGVRSRGERPPTRGT